ncbi:hypothetical protein CLV84_1439 [Neolewinella xylanilytica]|uniref:Outer membrane protein with beta-barrel domain n=1 Tax=Neolewinella xylanilytica TaxID=1514080 RepID=A0A2S6IAE7_9BACT|nr:hypothetical protein [Neolewinella xylanilytica]PPK88471.1 hypothetical protein CLV84_1439 [Neolewinella xylanilytica]
MTNSIVRLAVFVLCFIPFCLAGQNTPLAPTVRMLLEGNLEYGGDDLVTVFFTNGEDQRMTAGQGGTLAVGGEYKPTGVPLLLRATIGIKYNTEAADNANINFVRYPLNALGYVTFAKGFRAGAGLTTHLGARLKGDGFVDDVKFDTSLGTRFEFGWKWVAVTYTRLTYEAPFAGSFDGGSFGVSFSTTIPGSY